jgi:hypothetical protein
VVGALIWVIMFLPYFVNHYSYSAQRYHVFLVPMTILGVHLLGPRSGELLSLEFDPDSVLFNPRALKGLILIALPFILYLRLPTVQMIQSWTDTLLAAGVKPGRVLSIVAVGATLFLSVFAVAVFPLAFRAAENIQRPILP